MTWAGGCLCGAVRYEAKVSASENWYCQRGSKILSVLSICRTRLLLQLWLAPPEGHYGIESWISWLKIEDDLKKERTQKGGQG